MNTETDLQWAVDWVSNLATPPLPKPSAWDDVSWCNYWREQRHRVVMQIAALAAARLALHQELSNITSCASPDASAELEQVRYAYERAATAEGELTQLRQDLRALPRHKTAKIAEAFVTWQRDYDGDWIKARDLADRLAREEQA